MSWLLPPLPPTFEAALRDVRARARELRVAAAERLAEPPDSAQDRDLARQGLVALASDAAPSVRAAALRALGALADARALDCLIEHLRDPDALVRELATAAIAELAGPPARLALHAALRSPHPEVRFQAVAGLAEAAEPSDFEAVSQAMRDADAKVRANAARSLSSFGVAARDSLREALADGNASVRAETAMSLARLGDASGASELRAALESPEFMLEALEAVAGLRLDELREPTAAIAQSVLKPLAWKVAAARTLIRLEDPRGVQALRRILRAFRSTARSYAVHVVGELGVDELTGELLRLTHRFRGTDPEALVEALALLLPRNQTARHGLEKLARRRDRAGAEARRVLATVD
jgi:HEAT repeat protein